MTLLEIRTEIADRLGLTSSTDYARRDKPTLPRADQLSRDSARYAAHGRTSHNVNREQLPDVHER